MFNHLAFGFADYGVKPLEMTDTQIEDLYKVAKHSKYHLVYGKEKQKCSRCKAGIIQRKVQAGRSTFFVMLAKGRQI